jgi:hypothetical protein
MSNRFPPVKDLNRSARTWRNNALIFFVVGFLVGLIIGVGL